MPFTTENARAMGKLGGLKTKRKYGKKHYKKLANIKHSKTK